MYITLSPFFYYVANQDRIDDYIAIETNGCLPYHIASGKLRQLVSQYIKENSHGVDKSNEDSYIMYICDKLSQ